MITKRGKCAKRWFVNNEMRVITGSVIDIEDCLEYGDDTRIILMAEGVVFHFVARGVPPWELVLENRPDKSTGEWFEFFSDDTLGKYHMSDSAEEHEKIMATLRERTRFEVVWKKIKREGFDNKRGEECYRLATEAETVSDYPQALLYLLGAAKKNSPTAREIAKLILHEKVV